jgi:hypothetical protein
MPHSEEPLTFRGGLNRLRQCVEHRMQCSGALPVEGILKRSVRT